MPKRHTLVGLRDGSIDIARHIINFDLAVESGPTTRFVGTYGAVAQVIAGLARMAMELRSVLERDHQSGAVPVEHVQTCHIQKERWTDAVILQFVTPLGVPYTFAVNSRSASDMADLLKTESAKSTLTGSA